MLDIDVAGLASGAIMLSGSPLNQWALSRDAVDYCAAVAREFGIDTTNSKIMVESLKAIPRDSLQQMSRLIYQKVRIVLNRNSDLLYNFSRIRYILGKIFSLFLRVDASFGSKLFSKLKNCCCSY